MLSFKMTDEKEKIYKDFVENYDADIISFEKGYGGK